MFLEQPTHVFSTLALLNFCAPRLARASSAAVLRNFAAEFGEVSDRTASQVSHLRCRCMKAAFANRLFEGDRRVKTRCACFSSRPSSGRPSARSHQRVRPVGSADDRKNEPKVLDAARQRPVFLKRIVRSAVADDVAVRGQRPSVGLIPLMPLANAGPRIDPP